MLMRRQAARARGFTLLELLIVVCIIAVLVTMVITSLASARRRTQIAVAKSNIQAIKAALSMYESDTGRYPRRGAVVKGQEFYNDIAYVWAALHNRPTAALGGGPNSPYLDWKPEQIGVSPAVSAWDTDPNVTGNAAKQSVPVMPGQIFNQNQGGDDSFQTTTGQTAHLATGTNPYVFLDPWGNPYWYVEWASVPTSQKDALATAGQTMSSILDVGGTSSGETHTLTPHDPSKFDIWSYGPNGVNEGGEGDDVASWSDVKK